MIKKWWVTYPCYTGMEKRRVYLYLPRGYNDHPQRRYPVLYMFDGQNVFFDDNATFGKSWGLGRYLNYTKRPLIVVALECNSSPENGRLSEYTPFPFEDKEFGGPFQPRAKETMTWYIEKLKPYIDARYRTLPDREHTFIGGSSMGGLMSLYGVLHFNHIFSRAAVFSPTMDADFTALRKLVEASSPAPDTVIYMDYGLREFEYEPWSPENFAILAMDLMRKKTILTTRLIPNGDHSEASWEKQLPFAIQTILYEVKDL